MIGRPSGSMPWLVFGAAGAAMLGIVLLLPEGREPRREPLAERTPAMAAREAAHEAAREAPASQVGIAALPIGGPELVDSSNTPPALLASLVLTGAGDPMADQVDIDIPVPSPRPETPAVAESRVSEPGPPAPPDTTTPPPSAGLGKSDVASVDSPAKGEKLAEAAMAPEPDAGGGNRLLIPPVVLKAAWLDYPREARKRKSEGDVEVRILVDDAGGVSAVEIERGTSDESLNQAALAAARLMRFRAARQGDRPVAVWFNYLFSFRLPS